MISSIRFSSQRQTSHTSSPPPRLQKATAAKDSVHFGMGTHTYRMVGPDRIEISDGHSSKYYDIGLHLGWHGPNLDIMYDLRENGTSVGALFENTERCTGYVLGATTYKLSLAEVSN